MRGYYFITDSDLSRAGNLHDVGCAVAAGASVVQYRRKTGSSAELYREARELKAACGKALFLVNDRVDIALAVEADGVHIGRQDLPLPVVRALLPPGKVVGVSVSTPDEAAAAEKGGADYLGVGPMYETATKKDAGAPIGVERLRRIRRPCALPLVAIGGIRLDNARAVIQAGADMICAIGAVVGSPDVNRSVQAFERLFSEDIKHPCQKGATP